MNLKRFVREIPKLPLSALIFYLGVFLLWNIGIIPSPAGIVEFLENLYNRYGLIGLAIASFLEGIVYLGLYFPGSFIMVLAVFLSDGSFGALFSISLVVTIVLIITSVINYSLGRYLALQGNIPPHLIRKQGKFSKGLILSMLHPNLLAFYFFNAGIERRNPLKIIFVPIFAGPWGFLIFWIFSTFKATLKSGVENPWIMLILILIWLAVAFIWGHLSKRRRNKIENEIGLG